MAERSGAGFARTVDPDPSPLDVQDDAVAPRLITPDEAIEKISLLLLKEVSDVKQHLLTIAGIAIAAVIALDGTAVEVEEIVGLQESVNCALFVSSPH